MLNLQHNAHLCNAGRIFQPVLKVMAINEEWKLLDANSMTLPLYIIQRDYRYITTRHCFQN